MGQRIPNESSFNNNNQHQATASSSSTTLPTEIFIRIKSPTELLIRPASDKNAPLTAIPLSHPGLDEVAYAEIQLPFINIPPTATVSYSRHVYLRIRTDPVSFSHSAESETVVFGPDESGPSKFLAEALIGDVKTRTLRVLGRPGWVRDLVGWVTLGLDESKPFCGFEGASPAERIRRMDDWAANKVDEMTAETRRWRG